MASVVECIYEGEMVCQARHLDSGDVVHSDSRHLSHPSYFSPTDYVAMGVLSCSLSIIGYYADAREIDVEGMRGKVTTTISQRPYRIASMVMDIYMQDKPYTDREKAGIERVVEACPAHRSIHPDVEQVYVFHWGSEAAKP